MERYCPHCKRFLLRVHEDGRFDLAGRASVQMLIPLPKAGDKAVSLPSTVKCHALLCRLRRWINGWPWATGLIFLLFPTVGPSRATERDYAVNYVACWDKAYADAKDGRLGFRVLTRDTDADQGCHDGYMDAMDKILKGSRKDRILGRLVAMF